MDTPCYIPQFYFPKKTELIDHRLLKKNVELMNKVSHIFRNKQYLTECEFQAVTDICCLPRYMNLALFRATDTLNSQNDQVSLDQFKKAWSILTRGIDISDIDTLIYSILKKSENDHVTPDDFLPVLEDIILNHPALRFLENNEAFQERYIETVICRIFYDAHCPSGILTLKKFLKSKFSIILRSLTPAVDLYTVHNVFSYKQFYVLYCKLWSLDTDHDLAITETDLCNYNMGALARLAVERIVEIGHIMAFADPVVVPDDDTAVDTTTNVAYTATTSEPFTCLTYFDFIWFLLSEVDKSTLMAIEYWFRCLDIDGDGVLSGYELHQFWQDQDTKQQFYGNVPNENRIQFEDVMRQMNDLIQPDIPGQFTLKDFKKNGYLAERFFDTFINFDRFQVHESHQEGSIREQQMYEKKKILESGVYGGAYEPLVLTDDLGFPVLSTWNDYADIEYHRIILDENYANSYEEDDAYSDKTEGPERDTTDEEGLVIMSCSSHDSNNTDTDIISITHDLQTQDLQDTISDTTDNQDDFITICDDDSDTTSDTSSIISSSSASSETQSIPSTHPDIVSSNDQDLDLSTTTNSLSLTDLPPQSDNNSSSEEDDSSSSSDGNDTCSLNSPIGFIQSTEENSKLSSSEDTHTSYFELNHEQHDSNLPFVR
ncbi:MAG: hypothetical protein EXX96DRAFT_555457 [Benjaminiella poitrasii]|nr:MAG: hypothetical protein EXX96DRAFT_555457 [Benjaminiella poitrasii]